MIKWLLDLEGIRLGADAPLLVQWDSLLPGWTLAGLISVAALAILAAYRRERTTIGRRLALAAFRLALVSLVVTVLCRPTLVLQRNRVEESYVCLALDASLSMDTQEPYPDESLARTIARGAGLENPGALPEHSRLDLIKAALTGNGGRALKSLLAVNDLQLATFAGTVEARAWAESPETVDTLVPQLERITADGRSTDLARAVTQMIDGARGRRLAAIVLASDGQSTEPTSLGDALDRARGQKIPVFPIRIGSTQPRRDIDVGPLRAERSVFVKDLLAVEAQLSASGLTGPTPVSMRMIRERDGTTVASREVLLNPARAAMTVELTTKPTLSGRARYRVEASPIPGEYTLDNNAETIDLRVLDNRLKVLYVEGYPRYEYRYLKNALLREETVDLSVLLIEADEQFVQEGTEPIRRFPNSPEELNGYDVVLFGDVDPRGGWLTRAQMKMLLDYVGNHGGGFGLIAGEQAAPHRFAGTALEKLIPVRIDRDFLGRYDTPLTAGFRPRLTPEGSRSRLFQFDLESQPLERDDGRDQDALDTLPELYWIARTHGCKPGASTLAHHPIRQVPSTSSGGEEFLPLIVVGRYGAGKIFFQATDDTWRWRRHTGELIHDMYWLGVVRELMRGDRLAQSRRFIVRTDRRRYSYGVAVHTQVELFDPDLLLAYPEEIAIVVTGSGARVPASSAKVPPTTGDTSFVAARFPLHRLGPESNIFEGSWLPPRPGSFALQADGLGEGRGGGSPTVAIRVEQPDLEAQQPEANHQALERIAEATGGQMVELDQLESVFSTIRDRNVQIPDDIRESLWDSKLVLMLFVLVISMEWILRKAFGLL